MEYRNVIFLDIDGVLQPSYSQKRHEISREERDALPSMLAEKFNNPIFLTIDKYDAAAVYYDWAIDAVDNLKRILSFGEKNGKIIEIIISSDWRLSKSFEQLKALFQIYGLDSYVTETIPSTAYLSLKEKDLQAYLENHPALKNYVVIDDDSFLKCFTGHFFLVTKGFLRTEETDEICNYFENCW